MKKNDRPPVPRPTRPGQQSCPPPGQTPVNKILQLLIDSPLLSKSVWKFWYGFAARVDGRAGHLKFMNFGYAPEEGGRTVLDLDPADEPNRNTIQLYFHTVGRKSLEGQDVLEVGCGRGGGAYSLMKYARPRTLAGMDLSPHAVRLARESYPLPGLSFRQGDAENLPFPDASFDAVVNVESSHCYPAFRRFLAEVSRVLKPGGRFYFADFRRIHEMEDWERDIEESGFHLREKEDITADVVRALTQDSPGKERLIRRRIVRLLHPAFKKFACTVGSENYQSFIEGRRFYYRYLLVKA